MMWRHSHLSTSLMLMQAAISGVQGGPTPLSPSRLATLNLCKDPKVSQ